MAAADPAPYSSPVDTHPRDADGLLAMPPPTPFAPVLLPTAERAPAAPHPLGSLGVVTFNIHRGRSPEEILAEARRLARRPDVDVIGWQEAFTHRAAFPPLLRDGWETAYFDEGARELPVSWRAGALEYVDASQHLMHPGWPGRKRMKPARYVTRVTLRHRASGFLVTVLNTHLAPRTEDWDRPGHWRATTSAERAREHLARQAAMWRAVPGRYAVGTADLNMDFRSEAAVRPPGGPSRAWSNLAVANWAVLGTEQVLSTVTIPATGRDDLVYDCVHASARSLANGWLEFASHEALVGYGSDHAPVLVRFALR